MHFRDQARGRIGAGAGSVCSPCFVADPSPFHYSPFSLRPRRLLTRDLDIFSSKFLVVHLQAAVPITSGEHTTFMLCVKFKLHLYIDHRHLSLRLSFFLLASYHLLRVLDLRSSEWPTLTYILCTLHVIAATPSASGVAHLGP